MGLATETRQNIGIFVGDKVAVGIVYMHAVALIKVTRAGCVFVVVAESTIMTTTGIINACGSLSAL